MILYTNEKYSMYLVCSVICVINHIYNSHRLNIKYFFFSPSLHAETTCLSLDFVHRHSNFGYQLALVGLCDIASFILFESFLCKSMKPVNFCLPSTVNPHLIFVSEFKIIARQLVNF